MSMFYFDDIILYVYLNFICILLLLVVLYSQLNTHFAIFIYFSYLYFYKKLTLKVILCPKLLQHVTDQGCSFPMLQ